MGTVFGTILIAPESRMPQRSIIPRRGYFPQPGVCRARDDPRSGPSTMPPETCWGSVDAWIVDTGFAVGLRTPKNEFAFRLRLLAPAPVKPAPSALIIVTGPQPRVVLRTNPGLSKNVPSGHGSDGCCWAEGSHLGEVGVGRREVCGEGRGALSPRSLPDHHGHHLG